MVKLEIGTKHKIIENLTNRLGSEEIALKWLDCQNRVMGKTPREMIEEGNADIVEEYLNDIWGHK